MPRRKTILATGETYHIFNKIINDEPLLRRKVVAARFQRLLWYYQYQDPTIGYARYLNLSSQERVNFHNLLIENPKRVSVFAHTTMPNHYHLLLRQEGENGISRFLADVQNALSSWYNYAYKRKGPFFLPQFKAVHIETDEQLLHVSRYIHINITTGYVVKDVKGLDNYPWSSWKDYQEGFIETAYQIVDTSEILNHFASRDEYRKFVLDQIDYQRQLHKVKHLLLEGL